jgi:O-Antigen ligase/Tetratricopeptide repeat
VAIVRARALFDATVRFGVVPARLATVLVPATVIAAVAWSSGGYFPRTWGAVLLAEAIALAAVAILADQIELNRHALMLVGALSALAVWAAVSRAWAVAPDAAILEAERALLYAGAAAAAFLAVPRRRSEDLVLAVLVGAAIVTCGGLVEHVVAAGVPNDRLELPIGYANAAGILAATTLLLGLGLAAGGPRWRAALGAGAAVPAAAALYLSLSRGSIVAVALGIVVLGLTTRSWGAAGRIALAAAASGLAVALAAWVGVFEERDFADAELASLAALAILTVAAAVVATRPPRIPWPHIPRRVVVGVAVGAALVAAGGLVAIVVRDVRDVRTIPAAQQSAPDRLLRASTSFRGDYWDVALAMAGREPFVGSGAGGFERTWLAERPALLFVRDAHNLYLETLAELGAVGLALLLVALGVPLLAARRAAATIAGRTAMAAYAALLAHAVLDWDWELPAVSLCTLLLAVSLVRLGGVTGAVTLRADRRAALLAGAALLAVVALVAHVGNGSVAEANDALDRGDAAAAREGARRARRFAPWSAEPWQLLGEAELAAGRLGGARRALQRATSEDPGAWSAWLALAFASDGHEREAALARARHLNPLAPELDAVEAEDP